MLELMFHDTIVDVGYNFFYSVIAWRQNEGINQKIG